MWGTCPAVILKSPDTDVAVVGISVSHKISATLLFRTGTKQRIRYVDLTAIGKELKEDVCSGLPGYHAFTGSDSTSALVGRGKVKGFKLLTNNELFRRAMQQIGQSFEADGVLEAGEQAICTLYGDSHEKEVNQLRHSMFGACTTDPTRLPPCQDAARQHILRANYQAAVWRRCLEPSPDIPSPDGHGWKVSEGEIWMDNDPAPKMVLQCVSCTCTKCKDNRCSCRRNGLKCTGACGCSNCDNAARETDEDLLGSDSDSDSNE